MAWEYRERGGPYYYRNRKVRGRVVREYVGGGLVAELVAADDIEARQKREALRAEERMQREVVAAAVGDLLRLQDASLSLAQAVLADEGFHLHRGEWRRRTSA